LDTIAFVEITSNDEIPSIEEDTRLPDLAVGDHLTSTRIVVSIALTRGVHDLYSGFLPPLLPILIDKFGLTNLGGGSLTLFYSLPSHLQPVIGSLTEIRNLKILVILTPLITETVMTLLDLTSTPLIIMAMLVLAGLNSADLHANGPTLNSKHAGKRL